MNVTVVVGRVVMLSIAAVGLVFAASMPAAAIVINNGLPSTTVGYWSTDVISGGEVNAANITAVGTPSGTTHTNSQVIFDYFSYVDVGPLGAAVQLPATTVTSPAALTGTNQVSSAGTFAGAGGNTINWSVTSSIPAGGSVLSSTYSFTAAPGSLLGAIRFYQYLDEDVLGAGDDVFITRGSVATSDLQLFTIDNAEAIGVSHSGAFTAGLTNATFAGWAACTYNNMKGPIVAGTQAVSAAGEICAGLAGVPINHPVVGPGLGPRDIVSVLAWDVDPNAASASFITTLGGVPSAQDIPTDPSVPEPTTVSLLVTGLGGLVWRLRKRVNRV